ncbi:MAG: QueT transporter family protein [Firmicutes bacterium]|nr:QueT transporter family protein [Candidatus Colimorpha enterica]
MKTEIGVSLRRTAFAATVAACYVVLTYISSLVGLDKGFIQIRLSEVLTVLPFFTPCAIPGLFVGCIISGLLTAAALPDVIFGSLVTLVAAYLTFLAGKRKKTYLAPLPPVILNAVFIPLILKYVYTINIGLPILSLLILAGESVTAGIGGTLLITKLPASLTEQIKSI